MCNSKGNQSHKATPDQSTSRVGALLSTIKECALKSAPVMTTKIIDANASEVTEVEIHEWLADTTTSRHICNYMKMLRDVMQLDSSTIVMQMVGEVPVILCSKWCENEDGQVVLINLHDALLVSHLGVNLFSIQVFGLRFEV